MFDPFNSQIFVEVEHSNKESNNWVLEQVQEKDIDHQLLNERSSLSNSHSVKTNAAQGANSAGGAASGIVGTIPAVVSVVSVATVVTAFLVGAPKVDIVDVDVGFDRVNIVMNLEDTDNEYYLNLAGDGFSYDDTFLSGHFEEVIIGLEENTKYVLKISNDYCAGSTVLSKVTFTTKKTPIIINKGKISIDEELGYLIKKGNLTLNLVIDDPNSFLYDFKYVLLCINCWRNFSISIIMDNQSIYYASFNY